MISFPKAKINLGLRILKKRPDGFHNIETIFYPVGISDALEFVVSNELIDSDLLTVSGINISALPENNLVIKTVKKIRESYPLPYLKLHLHKAIPSGAGLGGGSSDAGCLLRSLNRYFSLEIDNDRLREIALELGSDCPFFLDCTPAFATGRGEIFTPIESVLDGLYLVLLNPGTEISTKEAYLNCHPGSPATSLMELINLPVENWKATILNDFEDYAFKKYPIIGEIKSSLYHSGALFSLMSGSGSSVYGIFRDRPEIA